MSSWKPVPGNGVGSQNESMQFQLIWQKLVINRWLVLAVMLVVIALTAVLTWRQAPIYASSATIRITDNSKQDILADLGSKVGGSGSRIETELLVLGSRKLAETVVDSLGLALSIAEPLGPRTAVFSDIRLPQDAPVGGFVLKRGAGGRYAVQAAEVYSGPAAPAEAVPGVPFTIGSAELTLAPSLVAQGPPEIAFSIAPFQSAVAGLRSVIGISRVDPKAEVVSISYRSTDPVLAAAVPNALASKYIGYKRLEGRTESQSAVSFLAKQVEDYERQLREAENRLREYREAAQVVNLADEATAQVQRLAKMQAERDGLVSEREALAPLLARVSVATSTTGPSPYRQLASFPVFLANTAVQNILQSLNSLEDSRAQLLVRRTPEDFDVQGINERIHELELQLYQIGRNYLQSLDSQIASADATLAHFGQQLATIPAREIEVARLTREQKLLGDIAGMLQTRLKESELQNALDAGTVQMVDSALQPTSPIAPNPVQNLVLALFVGLVLGVGAALGKEALDTKVRSDDDVRMATGGMPLLATIPRIQHGALVNGAAAKFPIKVDIPFQERLVTRLNPHSPASEAYRMLRTSVSFAGMGSDARVLVVTSAMPGDGKSTCSSNLAITMAQQGVKTLLIDADLRKGLLHQVFGIAQEPGLAHVLVGAIPLESAIRSVPVGEMGIPLDVLPTGIFPPNPSELLASPRMRDLLDSLRAKYDMVVIDAPPLNLVTDGAVLSSLADGTLLVTRSGVTDKRALNHAAMQLHRVQPRISGVVLNALDVSRAVYGNQYYGYAAEEHSNGKGKLARR